MLHSYKVAIVGATGLVGQTLLQLLQEQSFSANQLTLIASERSVGKKISYQDKALIVQDLAHFDFSSVQLAFFAAGSEVAKHYAPIAAAAGCWVIDKSSYFRLHPEIPLVIPEVNLDAVRKSKSKIIAVPNCSTIQLVMALKPLHDLAEIERVDVATYQAVSGAGKKGIQTLERETTSRHSRESGNPFLSSMEPSGMPIAFNVVPCIDTIQASGFTKEEMKMHEETCKIMNTQFVVNATAVRVPVWHGHSEAVHLKTRYPFSIQAAEDALRHMPGVQYLEKDIPTPVTHAVSNTAVWVGRLRRHPRDSDCFLNFWVVSDNLYKGAAANALQIAEKLLNLCEVQK